MNIVLLVQIGCWHDKWESNGILTLEGDFVHVRFYTKPPHINQATSLLKTPILAM